MNTNKDTNCEELVIEYTVDEYNYEIDDRFYEAEYYQYIDRLECIRTALSKIDIEEIDCIMKNYKPQKVVTYLYNLIKNIKEI